MVVALGIVSALLYGSADFLGGVASKRSPMLSVTLGAQTVGLLVLFGVVPFFRAAPTQAEILWSLAGGVCGGIGIALLYHALSIGKMGVVSPITAVLAAAMPVLVGILRGDSLRAFQLAGIAIALAAVVMISLSKEESGKREIATSGVKEAIASGIAIGCFFLVLGTVRSSAGLDGLLAARIGSVLCLLVLVLVTRTKPRPAGGTLPMVIASGAMDMSANVLYVIAAQTGELAIASVLTSLYPASTVLLAQIALRERLQLVQKIGVGLALLGVALIAA
ncbi:MAG TPA: DMT family transporter [Candidatus Baltobacteraceae bacterium]|nr:DMT family transporter [Candidatus Baltobacteraceae bacterium]